MVRVIFDRYPGMTVHGLVRLLNESGHYLPVKSPKRRKKHGRSHRPFDAKALADILSNEIYTGVVSWGKTTKVQGVQPEEFRHEVPELQIVSLESFNRVQSLLQERRGVPSRSQGSAHLYSGLIRCAECGGRTVGKRRKPGSQNKSEVTVYRCRNYHMRGSTVCKGWSVHEQTVTKAVIPFLTTLLSDKLPVQDHIEAKAKEIAQEDLGERGQRLKAEIATAQRQLTKVQEGYLNEVFTTDEVRSKSLELRERIERAERRLQTLAASADFKDELTRALRLLEGPLIDFIGSMPPVHLQRLCRSVLDHFSIRASGVGPKRVADVTSYEFTPLVQQALTECDHFVSNTPPSQRGRGFFALCGA